MKKILLLGLVLGLQSVWATTYTLNTSVISPQKNFQVDLNLEVEDYLLITGGIINGTITIHHLAQEEACIINTENPLTINNHKTDDLEDDHWMTLKSIRLNIYYIPIMHRMADIIIHIEHDNYPDDTIKIRQQAKVKKQVLIPQNSAWQSSSRASTDFSNKKTGRQYTNYGDAYKKPSSECDPAKQH